MSKKVTSRIEEEYDIEKIFYVLLEKEIKARIALEKAEYTLLEKQNQASHPEADDDLVEAFSRWLRSGRKEIREARAKLQAITFERDLVRQVLLERNIPDSSSVIGVPLMKGD